MTLIKIDAVQPLPRADAALVDTEALTRALRAETTAEVRFDAVSRALYATDASVYKLRPLGVVLPRTREDLVAIVRICARLKCPVTLRGGGTSQCGQAIGTGLVVDTSKYLNALLEVNTAERWARVQPGIVLDELNAHLRPHGLRFAPDVSTASRATVGGMMANNSSGARSVYYGKTIDHVIAQDVVLADGTITHFGPMAPDAVERASAPDTLEGRCYRTIRELARTHAEEVERRYPKVLRRVMGYNLDEFTRGERPFNLAKLMVGSEGTLGVVLEATINLVPLPKAKAVLAIQFADLLEALGATPRILTHGPSAVEVMDGFILAYTRQSAALTTMRDSFIEGDPGALLCVEFYADDAAALPPRLQALEDDLRANGLGYRYVHALDALTQSRVWGLREAALGLSMAMKDDAKSLSFVEDTAVPPERLRDYIERFLQIIRAHGTTAGIYAHASVGCLHVRPVVNLKTEAGVQTFEAIANDIADLVLEFGGALSGEHGDGLVRSPFMRKMFGPAIYDAFRTIKRTFDPDGILNPGKIVDAGAITDDLRFGAGYVTPRPETFFDYSEYGGLGGAVEMCSGVGACRKTIEGTMCPSYMATRDEQHTTRGRANVLRLAMTGRLGDAGLDDAGVYETLDLCLECRACKAECPVGVDMARFKSEFLAGYYQRNGTPLSARALGNARALARVGSAFAPLSNLVAGSAPARALTESLLGIDRRRQLPRFERDTLVRQAARRPAVARPAALLFVDTFTNHYDPAIGTAALDVLDAAGVPTALAANGCCGRPQISKGLLADAQALAARNADLLYESAAAGQPLVFCEPSCLSAVREDAPALLQGEARRKAQVVAKTTVLFEEFAAPLVTRLPLADGPSRILLHGHCHQRSMGLVAPAKALLEQIPGTTVTDSEAGCCGMAGSFGYGRDHYDVSRAIGERKLFPAVRGRADGTVVVAGGTSCRHQIHDFTGATALHPAILLRSLLGEVSPLMTLAWLSLGALVVAMIVSCFSALNVGVLGLALAWLVGVYIGGLPLNEVLGGFPTQLFLTLAGVTLLFTQAQMNGTLDRVAHSAVRICRGNDGLVPIMFFVLACLIASVGPGNVATAAMMAPMAMAVAGRAGIPPFLMAIMVGNGAQAGSLSPFAPTGIIVTPLMQRIGLGGHELETYLANLTAHAMVAFAGYFLMGGLRLFKTRDQNAAGEVAEQLPFTAQHGITLATIAAVLVVVLFLNANIGMAAFTGAVVLAILRVADHEQAIKKMPWTPIVMVCGVSVLVALLEKTKGLELFTSLLASVSTPGTLTGVVAFVTGIISVYSSTSGVVLPAFLPTVPGLVARLGGDPFAIATSMNVGAHLVDMSPLSTTGAMCLAGISDSSQVRPTYNKLLAWGMSMTVIGAIGCYLFF